MSAKSDFKGRPNANTLIVGCGPAARKNHIPILEQLSRNMPIRLCAVVDLDDRLEPVHEYFRSRRLRPEAVVGVPAGERDAPVLSRQVVDRLDALVARHGVDTVLVLTEPKAHLAYLRWAIPKGLRILVEKPLNAPVGASLSCEAARVIYADFLEVDRLLKDHPRAEVAIMSQRRYHSAYIFIREYLRDIIDTFSIPISYIDIFYSDGQWWMPDEYERENHPFKYGYGKLLHGGYHFIDVFGLLMALNDRIPEKRPDRVGVYTRSFRPLDSLMQIDPADYDRLLGCHREFEDGIVAGCPADRLGELDCYNHLQFKRGPRVITNANVNLLHNGFSRRSWRISAEDTYKGNGRVRHERITVNIGPLLSLQVHSYEAWESEKLDSAACNGDLGSPQHFDIHIFRNSGLIPGHPLEIVRFGGKHEEGAKASTTLVQEARVSCIRDFLQGRNAANDFRSHGRTCFLMSIISENLARETAGEVPYTKSRLPQHP